MKKHKDKYTKQRFAFLSLSTVFVLLFSIAPLFLGVYYSLFSGRGNEQEFAGLDNYKRIFTDPIVIKSILNMLFFLLVVVTLVIGISILLSNALSKIKSNKWRAFCSTVLFFPSITSPIAYAFFFKRLFDMNGILSNFLTNIGLVAESQNYLLTPWGAKLAIVFVCLWSFTGYFTILMLSARQNLDENIFKMAKMDGASSFQILRKVYIPKLKPVIILSLILITSSVLQLHAEIAIITQGGPRYETMTLVTYIYSLCFKYVPQFGYASSIGIFVFMLSSVLCFFQYKIEAKYENR